MSSQAHGKHGSQLPATVRFRLWGRSHQSSVQAELLTLGTVALQLPARCSERCPLSPSSLTECQTLTSETGCGLGEKMSDLWADCLLCARENILK